MATRIEFHKHGGPEVLQAVEFTPADPAENEIQVENKAIGINFIDTYIRSGLYPPPSLPSGLGTEAAGIVSKVGSGVKHIKAGDRVVYAQPHGASLYLPMEGLNSYRHAIAPLLFGADHPVLQQQRVATIQTLGGSGALKVGADFLKRYFPESGVWVSDPTWENHVAIFAGAGFEVSTYPWYDEATNGVRFNDLLATLKTLPARSIVLL
ncbi:aminotransferase class I/II-fold pyridoxal phosphate-dependent enzyme, partial [Escherichia sp. R-CC3]